ncbi:metal ABC transporter solute-binding protein, Zn/Mn family [Thermodesulfobacteriota bacterium]
MKPGRNKYILIFLSLLFLQPIQKTEGSGKSLSVFVSIPPQAYFVERIGGINISVDTLVLPGESPATYTPLPDQISKLAKARIFFRIGVPFENSLIPKIRAISKQLRIIDTRKGITLRKIESGNYNHKKHEGRSRSSGNDPHIWLDPSLVKRQAYTIFEALADLDSKKRGAYYNNYLSLIDDLNSLDTKIRQALEPVKGGILFVFHPAFGYFADAYDLRQVAVEVEGKAPRGKDLSLFIKKAREKNVRVVFVQPQFDKSAALKIASAIDGAVVSINPLERDYIQNLEKMAKKVAESLRQ